MPTWMQVVERLRERGHAPVSGLVSVQNVARALQPTPRSSVRALMAKALEGAVRRRWAIILSRYKGEMPNPALELPVEQFYRLAFTPGTGGMLEYWRDASLGAIDVSGSTVFGWVNLEIPLSQGGTGAGTTRGTTVDYAVNACRRANLDPTTGFYGQIAVITRNWTVLQTTQGSKFVYGVWRPVTAIRAADTDLNAETDPDPTWLPLIVTPPYPSYAGNLATIGASAARALELASGTSDMPVSVTWKQAGGLPDVVRQYDGFWQAADEEMMARIYGGVHYRFDQDAGQQVGRSVAEFVFANFMTPRRHRND